MKYYCNKSKRDKRALPHMYYSQPQIKEIISIAGSDGLTLMSLYAALATQANPNLEDAQLAKMTGLKERQISKVRLALTSAGWFKRTRTTINNIPVFLYDVGKESVAARLMGSNIINISPQKTSTP